jgi:hypothetical protein
MRYVSLLVLLLTGCITVVKHECAEDSFLEDEVNFKRNDKVAILFEEKFSFYENSCLKNGKVLELVGWEKGTLYYQVEMVCRSNDGRTYIRKSVKIPQHLLEKA